MSLKGAMREGDYGVFIPLSHYTKNAQKYLANTPIIRGIDGGELVGLVLKYYEELDVKYRRMIREILDREVFLWISFLMMSDEVLDLQIPYLRLLFCLGLL